MADMKKVYDDLIIINLYLIEYRQILYKAFKICKDLKRMFLYTFYFVISASTPKPPKKKKKEKEPKEKKKRKSKKKQSSDEEEDEDY